MSAPNRPVATGRRAPHRVDERLVQRSATSGRAAPMKLGRRPFGVAVERELAHHQHATRRRPAPPGSSCRRRRRTCAQVRTTCRPASGLFGRVVVRDAQEHEQPDRSPDGFAGDDHSRAHALENGTPLRVLVVRPPRAYSRLNADYSDDLRDVRESRKHGGKRLASPHKLDPHRRHAVWSGLRSRSPFGVESRAGTGRSKWEQPVESWWWASLTKSRATNGRSVSLPPLTLGREASPGRRVGRSRPTQVLPAASHLGRRTAEAHAEAAGYASGRPCSRSCERITECGVCARPAVRLGS